MPMKVKAAGAWQTAAAKVKVAGEWQSARTWVKAGGTWSWVGADVQDWDLHSDNGSPLGISWDGTYFYVADETNAKVYIYDADGNHQSNLDIDLHSGNSNPVDIASSTDGTLLYVVNRAYTGSNDRVYAYRGRGAAIPGGFAPSRSFLLYNHSPLGIALKAVYYYVADTTDDKVYVYDAWGNRQIDHEFDLHSDNGNPVGMTWDGTYFYAVDGSDRKVYVYDADGNHQSDRDFDLHSDNGSPTGIASNGTYLYVVDETDEKVYVYDADGTHVG